MSLRHRIKSHTPWPLHYLYRKVYYFPKDFVAACALVFHGTRTGTTFAERAALVRKFYSISYYVDCPHTEHEILTIARRILDLDPGVEGTIIEAGAFHGGSTAKLSLVAKLSHRTLDVFDSFEGMPENREMHGKSIYGREHHFPKGSHAVGLDEVKGNVTRYGVASVARYHKGWFSETMPGFREKIAVVCVNADLVQSTKDCVKNLYPRMERGGIFFSQDGHFPWIISLLKDDAFWEKEVGVKKPPMEGLGASKLVTIRADRRPAMR